MLFHPDPYKGYVLACSLSLYHAYLKTFALLLHKSDAFASSDNVLYPLQHVCTSNVRYYSHIMYILYLHLAPSPFKCHYFFPFCLSSIHPLCHAKHSLSAIRDACPLPKLSKSKTNRCHSR